MANGLNIYGTPNFQVWRFFILFKLAIMRKTIHETGAWARKQVFDSEPGLAGKGCQTVALLTMYYF
jgi:hypothetical protein